MGELHNYSVLSTFASIISLSITNFISKRCSLLSFVLFSPLFDEATFFEIMQTYFIVWRCQNVANFYIIKFFDVIENSIDQLGLKL